MSHAQNLIPAPNYTQCPNVLFDYWLPILGFAELKVFMVIIRKTLGWHKPDLRDRISLSQLQSLAGLDRKHITPAIDSLQERGLVTKETTGPNGSQQTFYKLIVSQEDSNNSYQWRKATGGVKPPTKESEAFLARQNPRKEQTKQNKAVVVPSESEERNPKAVASSSSSLEKQRLIISGMQPNVANPEQSEKIELLKEFELNPKLVREFLRYSIAELKDSIAAYHQYIEKEKSLGESVDNPQGLLAKSIRQCWKPNIKKVKANVVKQNKSQNLKQIREWKDVFGMHIWDKICIENPDFIEFKRGEVVSISIDNQEFVKTVNGILSTYIKGY